VRPNAGLSKLLETTQGDIIIGGKASSGKNKIEVTVVDNVLQDDVLLQSEIFGPILPILTIESKEEIAKYISKRDNPLALYVFTSNSVNSEYIFNNTRSGGFVRGDTLVQFL
jgi:aldehyde dehydrogenase (NAD+)